MNRLSGGPMRIRRLINYRLSRNLGKYQIDIRNAPDLDGLYGPSAGAHIDILSEGEFEKPKTIAEIRALLDGIQNPNQDDVHTYNIEALGKFTKDQWVRICVGGNQNASVEIMKSELNL